MRQSASLFPFFASGLTAFALVAAIFFSVDFAQAAQTSKKPAATCTCPNAANGTSKPKLARATEPLDEADEIAALESVQLALTQVADGSSYVWHRSHGRLSGIVQPTASFKDHRGQVCRHVVVVLNSLDTTKKTEAIACRLDTGIWELDG